MIFKLYEKGLDGGFQAMSEERNTKPLTHQMGKLMHMHSNRKGIATDMSRG